MENNDGGTAFPGKSFERDEYGEERYLPGMSLRDWFAGMALQGLLVKSREFLDVVNHAYKFADAMLKEREKNE